MLCRGPRNCPITPSRCPTKTQKLGALGHLDRIRGPLDAKTAGAGPDRYGSAGHFEHDNRYVIGRVQRAFFAVEVLALSWIGKVLGKLPSVRDSSEHLRSAITDTLQLAIPLEALELPAIHRLDQVDSSALKLEGSKVVYRQANLEDVFLRMTGRGLTE